MTRPVCAAIVLALLWLPATSRAELPAPIAEQLTTATYVYISSTRKDGSLSRPAEIWFFYHKGAIYVGTRPSSWRVRRIKAGRPQAKIWVGKPDGPSFMATGAIVDEPDVYELMFAAYAKKYPERWPKFEQDFRTGFKNGNRVLVKYTPQ